MMVLSDTGAFRTRVGDALVIEIALTSIRKGKRHCITEHRMPRRWCTGIFHDHKRRMEVGHQKLNMIVETGKNGHPTCFYTSGRETCATV